MNRVKVAFQRESHNSRDELYRLDMMKSFKRLPPRMLLTHVKVLLYPGEAITKINRKYVLTKLDFTLLTVAVKLEWGYRS